MVLACVASRVCSSPPRGGWTDTSCCTTKRSTTTQRKAMQDTDGRGPSSLGNTTDTRHECHPTLPTLLTLPIACRHWHMIHMAKQPTALVLVLVLMWLVVPVPVQVCCVGPRAGAKQWALEFYNLLPRKLFAQDAARPARWRRHSVQPFRVPLQLHNVPRAHCCPVYPDPEPRDLRSAWERARARTRQEHQRQERALRRCVTCSLCKVD